MARTHTSCPHAGVLDRGDITSFGLSGRAAWMEWSARGDRASWLKDQAVRLLRECERETLGMENGPNSPKTAARSIPGSSARALPHFFRSGRGLKSSRGWHPTNTSSRRHPVNPAASGTLSGTAALVTSPLRSLVTRALRSMRPAPAAATRRRWLLASSTSPNDACPQGSTGTGPQARDTLRRE